MASSHVHYEYEDGSNNTTRPKSVTYPDGRTLTYDYGTPGGMNDRLSRVESIGFDGTNNLVQPSYLGLGTQVRTTMPQPQIRMDLATGSSPNPYAGLDRFGRVIDNKWTNYNTATTVDQIKYSYDRASNRTSRENTVAKTQTPPQYFDEFYKYDGSNRLTEMQRGQLAGSPPTSVTNLQFSQDWNLDPTGNWKVFKEDATGAGTPSLDQTRTSNPVNEITAINETAGPSWVTPGYDSAGNMTTIPRPAEPTGNFTGVYDAWNRLVELRGLDGTVVARYKYDGISRRIVKETFPGWNELDAADWDAMTAEDWNGLQLTQAHRRDYFYNNNWQIVEERVDGASTFDRQYVWGLQYIDGLVFRDRQLTSGIERLYAIQDANWNVTALVNTSGNVVERFSYTPYGMPSFLKPDFTLTENQEAFDWDVLYAGYKWDSESSLLQVKYRYLQVSIGEWLNRDPIGYEAGDRNLYRYCINNPVTNADCYGLKVFLSCANVGGSKDIKFNIPIPDPNNPGWAQHCGIVACCEENDFCIRIDGAGEKPNPKSPQPKIVQGKYSELVGTTVVYSVQTTQDSCCAEIMCLAAAFGKIKQLPYSRLSLNSNTYAHALLRECAMRFEPNQYKEGIADYHTPWASKTGFVPPYAIGWDGDIDKYGVPNLPDKFGGQRPSRGD